MPSATAATSRRCFWGTSNVASADLFTYFMLTDLNVNGRLLAQSRLRADGGHPTWSAPTFAFAQKSCLYEGLGIHRHPPPT